MEGYSVSHFYHGLICFLNRQNAKIYNTSTRQLVVLPDINVIEDFNMKKIMYGIGHDPVHNQYKVVCTVSKPNVMTEIWVLLLGGGDGTSNRWRKISSPFQPHYRLTQGLTVNGHIYYVAWGRLNNLELVSFDIRSEEISIHQEDYPAFCRFCVDLIEYGGSVALLDYRLLGNEGKMKLWVMKDKDAEKLSWSGKTLVLHPSHKDIIQSIDLKVHGTTPKGEVILVSRTGMIIENSQSNVFLYNIQNNVLRKVTFKETSKHYRANCWDLTGFGDVENLMYL